MSKAIAFEGPDLTGKTSLIDALQKRMPYAMWPTLSIHSSTIALRQSSGQAIDTAGAAFYSSIASMARTLPVLLDRCYVTNYVYGSIFGRATNIKILNEVAQVLSPTIVYVFTSLEILLERLKWHGDEFVDRKVLVNIFEMYTHWFYDNPFSDKIIRIDSSQEPTVDDLAAAVAGRLEKGT